MDMRRTLCGAIGVGVAFLAGWGGVAFACTAQPTVYSVLPESAAPGSTVVVRGERVDSRSPVEIRWNGVKGSVLAVTSAEKGNLSVPVQIPNAAPGVYSLMLVTDNGVARTAFEVSDVAGSVPQSPAQVWPTLQAQPSSSASSSGGASSIGVALLAVGLVGLFAGSTVAVVRRRQLAATTPHAR